jgi:hypothetical protein
MKTPRVHDFDPNAKVPELGSPMDNFPSIQKPKQSTNISQDTLESEKHTPTPITPVPQNPVPYPSTPYGVPHPVPLIKRRMRQRQPFDVYEDQYESLKKIADDERAQGLPGSMSRMVREGIDMYLAVRKKVEK